MSAQDADMYPTASGDALGTVKQHQRPEDLVFWAGWFCPFTQRVWIALEERGIPYQHKEVNPYRKEKHFLDINPKGLVPAIEYKGRALYESLVLCEFLEDAYPSHVPRLLPADPVERGYVRLWVDHISRSVVPAFHRLLQSQTPEAQDVNRKDLYESLITVSAQVKGPFFLGTEFSLADIVIAPWVMRDYVLEKYRGYSRAAVGDMWTSWAEDIEQRESVLKAHSDPKYYEPIFSRHMSQQSNSQVVQATKAGRGLP